MKPVRFIFERGITIQRQDNDRWYFHAVDRGITPKEIDPKDVADAYGILPVVVTEEITREERVDFLLPKHIRNQLLDIGVSELLQSRLEDPTDLYKLFSLSYITGAVVYHCKQLACTYSDICLRFSRTSQFCGQEQERAIFGHQPEPYYEFDALITAARRAYDTTRYILWKYFGPRNGTVPSSFKKCLPHCTGLPESLKLYLSSSWDNYGEQLTNYRDCIQHHVPIDFGLSSACMERLSNGVWSVLLLIPDNPEAKSKSRLCYSKKIDALSYSWEITTEVVNVAKKIVLEASKRVGRSTQQGASADA